MHTSKANYYLDQEPLETDFMADPMEMPPFEIAERLVMAYMESCHNSFPFLAKKAVMSEFYHCKFSKCTIVWLFGYKSMPRITNTKYLLT